jgi:hypothetical protein
MLSRTAVAVLLVMALSCGAWAKAPVPATSPPPKAGETVVTRPDLLTSVTTASVIESMALRQGDVKQLSVKRGADIAAVQRMATAAQCAAAASAKCAAAAAKCAAQATKCAAQAVKCAAKVK